MLEVLFEGERAVGVKVQDEDGSEREVRAEVVVDASGQSSMIMSRLGLREWDPVLKKGGRVDLLGRGLSRHGPRRRGHDGPADAGQERLVLVHPAARRHRQRRRRGRPTTTCSRTGPASDYETIYIEEVARCPGVQRRIAEANAVRSFPPQKEYSYRSKRAAGDGWVLVGDAFGFLDPLYSSGVLLALKSGSLAADAVVEGLAKGDTSAAQLGKWEAGFVRGMDRMRRLVCEYYDGFSFGRFVKRHPHMKGAVTDLLIGDLFRDELDEVFMLMDEMKAEQGSFEEPAVAT